MSLPLATVCNHNSNPPGGNLTYDDVAPFFGKTFGGVPIINVRDNPNKCNPNAAYRRWREHRYTEFAKRKNPTYLMKHRPKGRGVGGYASRPYHTDLDFVKADSLAHAIDISRGQRGRAPRGYRLTGRMAGQNPPITQRQYESLQKGVECLYRADEDRAGHDVYDVALKHFNTDGGITRRRNPLPLMANPPITMDERDALNTAIGCVVGEASRPGTSKEEREVYKFTADRLKAIERRHEKAGEVVEFLPTKYRRNPELLMVGMNPGMGKTPEFKDLKVGQTFDFIHPTPGTSSFFLRVKKTGKKTYEDEHGGKYRVGSVKAKVFHVSENPSRRGKMKYHIRVKHRRRNGRRRARGFTRKVRFHGKMLTGFQIMKKHGKTAARRALGMNPKRRRGRRKSRR